MCYAANVNSTQPELHPFSCAMPTGANHRAGATLTPDISRYCEQQRNPTLDAALLQPSELSFAQVTSLSKYEPPRMRQSTHRAHR
jgi:hypothetical protein